MTSKNTIFKIDLKKIKNKIKTKIQINSKNIYNTYDIKNEIEKKMVRTISNHQCVFCGNNVSKTSICICNDSIERIEKTKKLRKKISDTFKITMEEIYRYSDSLSLSLST